MTATDTEPARSRAAMLRLTDPAARSTTTADAPQ